MRDGVNLAMSKKLCISILSLTALLGLTGGLYVVKEAIQPLIAQAYTMRVNLSLDRQPNESYETIIRRAEAIARAAVQRSFDTDILVNEASVMVTCDNNGLIAPIISVKVSRSQWSNIPDIQRWTRYYSNSRSLLDFDGVAVANAEQRRVEAAKPKVVLNEISVRRDFNSKINYVQGSVSNQTGNIIRFVKINYIVSTGIREQGDAGSAIVQPDTLTPGQVGLFKSIIDINSPTGRGIATVTSIEWQNDDGSSGLWRP
jgi:hypothetical protein